LGCLKKSNPDIACVDIVLKGDLNGIDLARILDKKISFYISFGKFKYNDVRTGYRDKPYGFLVSLSGKRNY